MNGIENKNDWVPGEKAFSPVTLSYGRIIISVKGVLGNVSFLLLFNIMVIIILKKEEKKKAPSTNHRATQNRITHVAVLSGELFLVQGGKLILIFYN